MATAKRAARPTTPTRKRATAKAVPKKTAKPPARRLPTPPPAKNGAVQLTTALPAPEKVKKPKLVRDSFTIPKAEYAVLDQLKLRAAKSGTQAKKSEVLRAGIKALAAMSDAAFSAALRAVPAIKTGRPAKS